MSLITVGWAWQQHLPPVEKLVLLALANHVSDSDWHHYDRRGAAIFAGVDEPKVVEALECLASAGLIERRDEASLDLVRLVIPEEEPDPSPAPKGVWERRGKTQYVYFARSRRLVKIGYSTEPEKRIKALRTSWPYPVDLLKVVCGGKRLEAEYHERFAHLREVGEWFRAADELVEFIESLEAVVL